MSRMGFLHGVGRWDRGTRGKRKGFDVDNFDIFVPMNSLTECFP